MLSKYQRVRNVRREGRTIAGRFRGGKSSPIMAVPFRESESGVLSQSVFFELDPIPGRLITPVTMEIVSVYVPAPAIDALKNPEANLPGSSDVFRQKLLSGLDVFGMEQETEISKRLGVVPRSINGQKMVNASARLAYLCAVNYLARRKYVNASQSVASRTSPMHALLGQTVLDRLNGVLNPEDRVNGKVDLAGSIPVRGIAAALANTGGTKSLTGRDSSGEEVTYSQGEWVDNNGNQLYVNMAGGKPHLFADLADAADISLSAFYTAERMDRLTREMRSIVDNNPVYGEELVRRFAHGLSIDVGSQPFVLYQAERTFGQSLVRGMDAAGLDVTQTNSALQMNFSVPVPATEFGGVVVTIASLKPDETLAEQPHPIFSEEWKAINYAADELAIDPVPVTVRDLYADCDQVDENTLAFYIGNNHLKRNYVNYGFSRQLNRNTVAAKSSIWQIQVPMSVTPESVFYPSNLDHYPFADQNAEVCQYTISSTARINTPLIFGPSPVEELAEIEDADIFGDAGGLGGVGGAIEDALGG